MSDALLRELIAALEEAHRVLGERWFVSTDDGDEQNDDEVIAADKLVMAALAKAKAASA